MKYGDLVLSKKNNKIDPTNVGVIANQLIYTLITLNDNDVDLKLITYPCIIWNNKNIDLIEDINIDDIILKKDYIFYLGFRWKH